MIFEAYGPEWKRFFGGFYNRDASEMWNGSGALITTEGFSNYADMAQGIALKFPPLLSRAGSEAYSVATSFKSGIVHVGDEPAADGLNENGQIDFRLYPNPNEGELIDLQIDGEFKYQITDINGRLIVMGSGADNVEIDLTQVENGIYFITLEQNEITKTEKLIVR
tara:strand:+ start:7672 stop:8169 length:498 start_codon:yes stop_codon:yes gene_type:complete